MITSGEIFKGDAFDQIMLIGYNYNDIIMRLEEEEEEEAEEIEDLKEKQKRLKEEMLKKRRLEKDKEKNGEPH
jgi:hypothetical protein